MICNLLIYHIFHLFSGPKTLDTNREKKKKEANADIEKPYMITTED